MNESRKALVRVHREGQLTLATYKIGRRRVVHMTVDAKPDTLLVCAEELERLRTLCEEEAR